MKYFILFILTIGIAIPVNGQRKERREQIKTLKIAFITERLELSPAEAQAFWPIYNEFEESYSALRKNKHKTRKDVNIVEVSDTEAQMVLDQMLEIDKQKYEMKERFYDDLLAVISAKKIIMLKEAEDDFNRKMIEEFKRRKQEREKRP